MRGPYQESRAIPHAFREVPSTAVARGGWAVQLMPHDDEPVLCPTGATMGEAMRHAEAHVAKHFPGRAF